MDGPKNARDTSELFERVDASFDQIGSNPIFAARYTITPVRMRLFRNDECVDVNLEVGRRKGTTSYASLTAYWSVVRQIAHGDYHPGQKARSVLELHSTVLISDPTYVRNGKSSPARSIIADGLQRLLVYCLKEEAGLQSVVFSEEYREKQEALLRQVGSEENKTFLADILFAYPCHVKAIQEHERRGHFRELVPYRARLSKVDVRWVGC